MKRLGLIGGMSWESTQTYYRLLNQSVRRRLGGLHSAELLIHSVDFQPIESLQRNGDWAAAGKILANAAVGLQSAGAKAILLCTNTMHKVAAAIEASVDIPLIHIADATAQAIHRAGYQRVALLGTRFTMEEAFYRQRLTDAAGIEVLVPQADDRQMIDRVIFDELCRGEIRQQSRLGYQKVIEKLVEGGAQAVILGCTEIGLLLSADDCAAPLFDTTALHVDAALDWSLGPAQPPHAAAQPAV